MLKFLFWNINQKFLHKEIIQLKDDYDLDVIVLCESPFIAELIDNLNLNESSKFNLVHSNSRLQIYTRFDKRFIHSVYDDTSKKITIKRISLPAREEFLLVCLHLSSLTNKRNDSLNTAAMRYAGDIKETEKGQSLERTVVVGDFNLNPFDTGMVASEGFHSVMTKERALKINRTVDAKISNYFYNPMWGHFGDYHPGVSGTYHYPASEEVAYFWNIFDQVLLRPSLVNRLTNLKIIDKIGNTSLLTKQGVPNKNTYSDHLPVFFSLNI